MLKPASRSTILPEDSLKEILELASLSPSSHNTQPWIVHTEERGSLVVGYRPERHLKVGDPNKRELFISLGCFVESICLAADERDYATSVTFLGTDPRGSIRLEFTRNTGSGTDSKKWGELIRARRSDRRLYEDRRLTPQDSSDLETLGDESTRVVVIDQSPNIEFLATMTREATRETMLTKPFRDELASWVRNNWTRKPDGMPGYTQGMPGPISLLAKFVIRKNKRVAYDQAKKDGTRVAHSAAIGLICVKEDVPVAWVKAGRLYQRACIEAQQRNIRTAGVSAALISPTTSKKIIKKFELRGTPVALLRFGYKNGSPKATPRLRQSQFSD